IVTNTPAPVANFSAGPTNGTAPFTVAFTNLSTGAITSNSWNFGDGFFSTNAAPSHTYSNAGNYTVSLSVFGPGGSNTNTKANFISVSAPPVPPVANFSGSPIFGAAPLLVTFTNLTSGSVTNYNWTFGDSGSSTNANPTHTYSNAGSYTVR